MRRMLTALALSTVGLAGCDGGGAPQAALAEDTGAARAGGPVTAAVCEVAAAGSPLPDEVRETSGLARGRGDPRRFWTHNDAGNEPELFALTPEGALAGRVRVENARLEDWEDVEAAPCGDGSCLYVGDIGDNDGERSGVTIYEIPEPRAGATTARARALNARFPDGPRDSEALFAHGGALYLVTKGRQGPIALYRYPAPLRPGETVTLERVRELAPEPRDQDDRVTSATTSADGRWVGIRSYRTLLLYPAAALVGSGAAEPLRVDLAPLGEGQGEALAIGEDGTVWTTSEAANKDSRPTWGRLRCTLPATGG